MQSISKIGPRVEYYDRSFLYSAYLSYYLTLESGLQCACYVTRETGNNGHIIYVYPNYILNVEIGLILLSTLYFFAVPKGLSIIISDANNNCHLDEEVEQEARYTQYSISLVWSTLLQ